MSALLNVPYGLPSGNFPLWMVFLVIGVVVTAVWYTSKR